MLLCCDVGVEQCSRFKFWESGRCFFSGIFQGLYGTGSQIIRWKHLMSKNTDKPFDCHSHSQHVMAVHHLSSLHRGIGVPAIHLGSLLKALHYSAVIKLSGVYPHML